MLLQSPPDNIHSVQGAAMFDPIAQDPPHDADFPAHMSELELTVDESLLNGVIYHPAGETAHPLIIILHGIPGHEKNIDLAQVLRRAGYASCVFHYRGSWGSGGAYRFTHILEDVQAVVAYFRATANATQYNIDPEKITLIGHSLGGWAALMTAANSVVDSAVSLSGVNVGLWAQQLIDEPEMVRPMFTDFIERSLAPLHGATADAIITEIEANRDTWDLNQQAEKLRDKNLLIVGAKRDVIASVFDHHMPLVNALKANKAEHLTTKLLAADHSYSGNRVELMRAILAWLNA
ncbi:MAG: alpha/beta fold hydrolase [Phototrophicaceae bacterium]